MSACNKHCTPHSIVKTNIKSEFLWIHKMNLLHNSVGSWHSKWLTNNLSMMNSGHRSSPLAAKPPRVAPAGWAPLNARPEIKSHFSLLPPQVISCICHPTLGWTFYWTVACRARAETWVWGKPAWSHRKAEPWSVPPCWSRSPWRHPPREMSSHGNLVLWQRYLSEKELS